VPGNQNKKYGLTLSRFLCDDGEKERRTEDIILDAVVSGYMGLFAEEAGGGGGEAGGDIVRRCRISRLHSTYPASPCGCAFVARACHRVL